MNQEQKKQAKARLRRSFGAGITSEVAVKTGFSQGYVRKWFTSDFPQMEIQGCVLRMLRELECHEAELKNLLP